MNISFIQTPRATVVDAHPDTRDPETRRAAHDFATAFIAAVMKDAGLEKALAGDVGFGGAAMAGLLVEHFAKEMAARDALGIDHWIRRAIATDVDGASGP